ncbi:MAG: 3-phosphoshikimate 1-carboxyvinyltransferase [Clostridia bacterium]|nr:3-phosphoshikimate 1-carboxyvinyltransferase [Clostridia bacterium]
MKVRLSPSKLNGEVAPPPSKSCLHRALICAAVADAPTKILASSFSKDIEATASCLTALGARIDYEDGFVIVHPIEKVQSECTLDCNESGSTLRFMIPFAAALGSKCTFVGAERLGKRPLLPLCDALTKNGVKVSYGESFLPCTIEGRLSRGIYEIEGNISSQFITGLLLALGVLGGGEIRSTTPLESASYIDITTDIQEKFGVLAEKKGNSFVVAGGQKYTSPSVFKTEGDYSNAAFFLVAGAISSDSGLTVSSLHEKTCQGDSKIIEILEKMGAQVKRNEDKVTVFKSKLSAVEIDCSDIPDLVPVLCVAAASAEGRSVFYNINRLRMKESDRVQSTADMISSLGGKIEFDENNIYVTGTALKGGTVSSANDHRIAMSGAVASLVCDGDVIIEDAQAVEKSYGDFYEKFRQLGGKCSEF